MKHARYNAPPAWITETLFPSAALPNNFTQKFHHSILWDSNKEMWCSQPKDTSEPEVRLWLNWVVHSFGNAFKLFKKKNGHVKDPHYDRSWDNRIVNSGPIGDSLYKKPDIPPLSRRACSRLLGDDRHGWSVIEAFAETTRDQKTFETTVQNITEKAYLMFESQPF